MFLEAAVSVLIRKRTFSPLRSGKVIKVAVWENFSGVDEAVFGCNFVRAFFAFFHLNDPNFLGQNRRRRQNDEGNEKDSHHSRSRQRLKVKKIFEFSFVVSLRLSRFVRIASKELRRLKKGALSWLFVFPRSRRRLRRRHRTCNITRTTRNMTKQSSNNDDDANGLVKG